MAKTTTSPSTTTGKTAKREKKKKAEFRVTGPLGGTITVQMPKRFFGFKFTRG